MTPTPSSPPPVPTGHRSVAASRSGTSPKIVAIVLLAVLAFAIVGAGVFAAILLPTIGKVRETARRTVDASNIRQIVQASLIYATDHGGALPQATLGGDGGLAGESPATIESVMAALAAGGGLSDLSCWYSVSDPAPAPAVAFDYVTGLTYNMAPTTPVAWTRGLRLDGTWDRRDGVYGADGGHIVFLGGNVTFFADLRGAPLVGLDGGRTGNILETLPTGARVVGAGPGTLHGHQGRGTPGHP